MPYLPINSKLEAQAVSQHVFEQLREMMRCSERASIGAFLLDYIKIWAPLMKQSRETTDGLLDCLCVTNLMTDVLREGLQQEKSEKPDTEACLRYIAHTFRSLCVPGRWPAVNQLIRQELDFLLRQTGKLTANTDHKKLCWTSSSHVDLQAAIEIGKLSRSRIDGIADEVLLRSYDDYLQRRYNIISTLMIQNMTALVVDYWRETVRPNWIKNSGDESAKSIIKKHAKMHRSLMEKYASLKPDNENCDECRFDDLIVNIHFVRELAVQMLSEKEASKRFLQQTETAFVESQVLDLREKLNELTANSRPDPHILARALFDLYDIENALQQLV